MEHAGEAYVILYNCSIPFFSCCGQGFHISTDVCIMNGCIILIFLCVCVQGVLRDDEDLSVLGDDFKQAYQSRKVDLFDDDGW